MAGGQLPASLRTPTISPTSPRHRGPTTKSLVAGKRRLFPTQSCRQVEHCSRPLQTSHPDPGGDTGQGLLLLSAPKSAFFFPNHSIHHLSLKAVNFQHTKPSNSRFSSLPHTPPCPQDTQPQGQHEKPSAPTPAPIPGAGSLPQPGRTRGLPVCTAPFLAVTAKLQAAHPTLRTHNAGQRVTQLNVEAWASPYYKIQLTHTRAD